VEVIQSHEFSDDIGKRFLDIAASWRSVIECSCPVRSHKFPLLLSKGSQFVKSYVSYLQVTNCHAGPRALVSM